MKDETGLETADAGVVIQQPGQGLGYQVAGALQRLGRRMIGFLPTPDAKTAITNIPMQTVTFNWDGISASPQAPIAPQLRGVITAPFGAAVLTLEPELSQPGVPPFLRLEKLAALSRALVELQPLVKIVFVLPETTPQNFTQSLLQEFTRATVLLSPTLFGFRDLGIFDQALSFVQKKPGLLLRSATDAATRLAFVGDVASLVTSALSQTECEGKALAIPPNIIGVENFRIAFNSSFEPKTSFLERLATRLSAEHLGDRFEKPESNIPSAAVTTLSVPSAYEFFPSVPTAPSRIFDQLARLHQREPALELVFPPSRSL